MGKHWFNELEEQLNDYRRQEIEKWGHGPVPVRAIKSYRELADWVNANQRPIDPRPVVIEELRPHAHDEHTTDHYDFPTLPSSWCRVFPRRLTRFGSYETSHLHYYVTALDPHQPPRMLTIWTIDPAIPNFTCPINRLPWIYSLTENFRHFDIWLFRSEEDSLVDIH